MKLKKLSILLCTLSLVSFTNYSNAQVAIPDGLINPEMVERGKGFVKGIGKKFGKQAAIEAGKKVAQVTVVPMLLHPKKTMSVAAVAAAGAGAGFWWYSTTIPYAVKKLAKDPTDFEIYWDNLADDFDKKLDFAQTAWDLYYENTGEEQKKYEDLIVLLGYERPSLINDLVNPVMINPKTKVEQEDLEKTNDFTLAMAQVDALAAQMDLQYEPLCKGQRGQQIREQLYKLTPKDFEKLQLINNNNITADFFNVDSYSKLIPKYQITERDHIPSYDSLEKIFAITPNIRISKKGRREKIKHHNLENNATAINVPYKLHRHNRTSSQIYVNDKNNLRKATLLDFTTLLVLKKFDSKNKFNLKNIIYSENDLLAAFSYVYGRNAQLCLYY